MNGGYEQIYENLVIKLNACDLAEAAERLGLDVHSDGTISVYFLGREYEISSSGVLPKDGMPVGVNNRSVLAYYTLSRGLGEPAFSFVPISWFDEAGLIPGTHIKWMIAPLGQAFGGNYPLFRETMERLGGVFEGRKKSDGYSWLLNVLPKIPMQIIYYEADDEFPCEVRILFDKNASRFMEFECLAFLEGCLVRALIMTAKTGSATGWD